MAKQNSKLAFDLAIQGLKTNRVRTFLTTVGIIIGISTIVIVLAAGRGLEDFILNQMESFGSDTIEIEVKLPSTSDLEMVSAMIGGAEVTTLKIKDFEEAAKLPNINNYYAAIIGQFETHSQTGSKRAMILGVTPGIQATDKDLKLDSGRFYTEREDKSISKVVVLGSNVKDSLFGDQNAIGKNIKINQVNFKVIGVAEERGIVFGFNYNNMIYVPLKTAQKLLLGIDHVLYGFLTVNDTTKVDQTVDDIIWLLRNRHGLPHQEETIKDDFRVTSMQEAMEILGTVTFGITLLVMAVAAISLIVGGVGIMNIMYLSVLERTREIGLRKALGASNSIIRLQFLYEAIIITLVGGAIGIVFGAIVVFIIDVIAQSQGFDFTLGVGIDGVLLGLTASIVFGVLFGLYPARKASRLKPVDALRWE